MKKLALFDFCETLVSFQTAGPYIDFIRNNVQSKQMLRLEKIRSVLKKTRVTAVFNKLFPLYNFDKRVKLLQLRGFNKSTLERFAEEYYKNFIIPHLIPELVDEIKKKQSQGFIVTIVSGGFSIYMDYFAKDHNINNVIASEISFDANEICTGKIKGNDCMFHYKIDKLITHFSSEKINASESVAYSDSITDLPLLAWAGEGVVVSNEQSQSWAKLNGLSEIVWKKHEPLISK